MFIRLGRKISLVVIGVLIGASTTTIAWASIPDSSGVIHGCYSSLTGALKVIDVGHGGTCGPLEKSLNWSQDIPQTQNISGYKLVNAPQTNEGLFTIQGIGAFSLGPNAGDSCSPTSGQPVGAEYTNKSNVVEFVYFEGGDTLIPPGETLSGQGSVGGVTTGASPSPEPMLIVSGSTQVLVNFVAEFFSPTNGATDSGTCLYTWSYPNAT